MTTSAHFAASAGVVTDKPCASALAFDLLFGASPTFTCTPLSFRLSACACPCDPYPMMATFFARIRPSSASSS